MGVIDLRPMEAIFRLQSEFLGTGLGLAVRGAVRAAEERADGVATYADGRIARYAGAARNIFQYLHDDNACGS